MSRGVANIVGCFHGIKLTPCATRVGKTAFGVENKGPEFGALFVCKKARLCAMVGIPENIGSFCYFKERSFLLPLWQ